MLFFSFNRRSAGKRLWHFGALFGWNQSLCDSHRGVSHAERTDDPQPGLRPRQKVQTQHLAQLQLHGAAIRLWKSSVGKWHTRSSRFFLPKIQSPWFWYQCSANVKGSNSWFKYVYFSHKRWDISFFISQTKKN